MTTTHVLVSWFAGDDWEIRATLLDENGAPYNLGSSGTAVLWALNNKAGQLVLDEDDVTFTITDPAAGKCTILITSAKTLNLPGGAYYDTLRIVTGGITSTLATGQIYVLANPWTAAGTGIETLGRQGPRLRRVN